jgi:hypothetical protein
MFMQDFGGLESFTPSEGGASGTEQLSEEAKQRFAQAQQQIKQTAKEEKKSRKRDDRVAQTIRQFLSDDKQAHLFQLISALAARDCPSVFILAILSLIHEGALSAVEEYILENKMMIVQPDVHGLTRKEEMPLPINVQEKIFQWSSRLELVLSIDADKILTKLMVDEHNIDGTVLQLTTFVVVDFFDMMSLHAPYEELQPLTMKILQDLLEPYMATMVEHFKQLKEAAEEKD